MEIYDVVIFYDENFLLEYRLNLLYEFVDYFIVIESKWTHSGKPKPLFFDEARFERFADKLHYFVLDDCPVKYGAYEQKENSEAWRNEIDHRNQGMLHAINLKINIGDIVFITDIDEIVNPRVVKSIRDGDLKIEPGYVYALEQDMYVYNLHTKQRHRWYHAKVIEWGTVYFNKAPFSLIRLVSPNNGCCKVIPQAGWHLSSFKSPEKIAEKLASFAHVEYDLPDLVDVDSIQKRINDSIDPVGRTDIILETVSLNTNYNLPSRWRTYLMDYI